jgi:hypothetical protein
MHSPRASTLISTATRAEPAMTRRFRPVRTQTSATSKASPEVVYDTIADLRAHLEWFGERASSDTFKRSSSTHRRGRQPRARRSPRAVPRTTAPSTIARSSGRPRGRPGSRSRRTLAWTAKCGEPWEAHFSHRYDIEPDGGCSKIVYTETIERANYTPYWRNALVRPIFRPLVRPEATPEPRAERFVVRPPPSAPERLRSRCCCRYLCG